jgi:hypothetical protein
LRLAIVAAVLIGGYLLVAKPLLDDANKAIRPATHRIDRVRRCVEHAHGDAHRVFHCSAKF